MKLPTLLTQITPLPYYIQPIGPERYIEGQGPAMVADLQRNDCLTEAETHRADITGAYLVHCANTMPELVKALEDCVKCLTMDSDSEKDYAPEIKQARALLARANEIKI